MIFESIANEYERVRLNELKEGGFTSALPMRFSVEQQTAKGKPGMISELVKEIRSSRELEFVSLDFLILRELTGQSFRMFDFEALDRWCAKEHQCGPR